MAFGIDDALMFGGLASGLAGLFGGGGKKKAPSYEDIMQSVEKYMYMPQYTGQTEKGLFDLFEQLTGRRGGVEQIPFDIGLPTTGLYDALTRGIKEEFLGTPGGPEGGKVADLRAYYNNVGIPEQAVNQERLAYKDLNQQLMDQAAKINETQKDRLTNILNMGLNTGSNLYGQNLAQHRANTASALGAVGAEVELQDAIRQANQANISDLFSNSFGGLGTYFGAQSNDTSSKYPSLNQMLASGFQPGPDGWAKASPTAKMLGV